MGGFFTKVGDFFRGAFGEDDEEKRRRKQREAQAAANARKQAPKQNQQGWQGVFGNAVKTATGANIEPEKKKPLFQAEQPKPAPRAGQPLPDQRFTALSAGEKKAKTVFGKDVSGLIPGSSNDYTRTVNADKQVKTNKDKYVAQYDKLSPEYQKILVNQATEKAKKGDKAAANTIKALRDSGRLKGDAWDFIEGSNERFLGGTNRALLRGADALLPGKNTFGLEALADDMDAGKNSTRQITDLGKTGEKVGTAQKMGLDIASIVLPQGAIDKGLKGVTIVQKFKDGSQLVRYGDKLVRLIPGSVAGSAIDTLQQIGRGDDVNAGKSVATGVGTDLAVGAIPGIGRGLRRFFGKGGDLVDDAVSTVAQKRRPIQEALDNPPELEGARPRTAKEQELEAVINDEAAPAFRRKEAKEQLDEIIAKVDGKPDPLDRPAFLHREDLQEAVNKVQDDFNDYLNKNPDLTKQQIDEARQQASERALKLADELKANRYGTEQAIAKQADETAETVAQQQDTVADVQAQQAAQTQPDPGSVVTDAKATGSPEVAANDGYTPRQTTDEIINADSPRFQERDGLSIGQKLSPDRLIRENITRPAGEAIDDAIYGLQTSDNKVAQGIGRFFTGFSREAGVNPALQTARMQMRGGVEMGKINRQSIGELRGNLTDDQLTDVWSTIDTDFAGRMGKNVPVESLTPEQQVLRQKLVDIRDNTTVENMRRNLITQEQAANGEYINRDYSIFYEPDSDIGKFEKGFRQELLGQYKGRKTVSDEMVEKAITDPAYLVAKKQAQSEAAWAMQDYGNFLLDNGNAVDRARPGFVQLPDTPLFGKSAGKFVPKNLAEDFTGFQYDMAMVSAFNDMITAYDRIGIRQAKKQLLTIFNPAVRLGNQVTNRGIFSQLNGVNPIQFNIAMQSAKEEIANNGQLYREAVQEGLTGVDITQAEFFAQRVAQAAEGDQNLAKKALEWTKNSYSGADDQARVAAYMVKRNQGYDPVEAARQVQRGFQDYKSVGFFYDMASKTPIIGNAFVRFAADSMRIAKNAAVDHPLRTAGTIALWSTFVNGMSVISGESELKGDNIASKAFNLATGKSKSDAQKNREDRFGAPKLPFTNISTAVQTPIGEINVARFMPWYQLNNIEGAGLERVLPFSQSPVEMEDGKLKINPQGMQDPLLGQLVQLGIDEDFRGKSIRDPKAVDDKYAMAPLTAAEQLKNVGRFLFNNNAPVGREIDQLVSSARGEGDLYGKERTFPQAIARALGFKIEEQGDEQAKKRRSTEAYFEDKEQIDKELEGMTPAEQEAWRRLTGYYKLREQVPNEFEEGELRDLKAEVYGFSEDKWKDFASNPRLYKMMVEKKRREMERDGKPIAPEFDERLSEAFRTQLIQNKMVAPGDDAELDQRMYSTPEWDYYMKLKDAYKEEASKYYPESDKEDFDDETVKHNDGKFPEKPDMLKAYSAAYKEYADGKREKPQWNDALTAQKEAYNKETLDWTNQARKARGLPAITWDVWNNPTFGFDESPSGGGGGYARGGGGGGGGRDVNTLTELTNFGNSVKRYDPIEADAMPNIVAIFNKLMAGKGGGRSKPKLGASSSGRG